MKTFSSSVLIIVIIVIVVQVRICIQRLKVHTVPQNT